MKNNLVEGPQEDKDAKGWLHNIVIMDKAWDSDEIRLNIDTKLMNKWVVKIKYSIPTPEELQHKFKGSDKFTTLDERDSFFHFGLDNKSQDSLGGDSKRQRYGAASLLKYCPWRNTDMSTEQPQIWSTVPNRIFENLII